MVKTLPKTSVTVFQYSLQLWYIFQAIATIIRIIFQLNYPTLPFSSSLTLISFQPTPVILLKEGTDSSQGIPQLISNINACQVRKSKPSLSLVVCCFFCIHSLCKRRDFFFFCCQVIAEAVRTTLGPRGMDKLIVDGRGTELCEVEA